MRKYRQQLPNSLSKTQTTLAFDGKRAYSYGNRCTSRMRLCKYRPPARFGTRHVHLQQHAVSHHRCIVHIHHECSLLLYFRNSSQNAKVVHLTSQLLASSSASRRSDADPDAPDEDELFAELEAEIENDDGPLREQGLKELQREYGGAVYLLCKFRS